MMSTVAFCVLVRLVPLKVTVISADAPAGISVMFEEMVKRELLVFKALMIRGLLPLLEMVMVCVLETFFCASPKFTDSMLSWLIGAFLSCFGESFEKSSLMLMAKWTRFVASRESLVL